MRDLINKRIFGLVTWDFLVTFLAYALAAAITGQMYLLHTTETLYVVAVLAIINTLVYGFFHLYSGLWEYASSDDLITLVIAVFLGSLAGSLILWIIDSRIPIRVYITATILLILFVGGIRFAVKYLYGKRKKLIRKGQHQPPRLRTMIVGAGETGSMTIKRMAMGDYSLFGLPVVAVDDDSAKQGMHIHGVRVAGTTNDILSLVDKYRIEQIVVAMPSASADDRRRIFTVSMETDCKLLTLPDVIKDMRVSELDNVSLREVEVNDLLGREEIMLDCDVASTYITGKTILVTGGGGSIGSEIVREICQVDPAAVILFDIYENGVFELRGELLEHGCQAQIIIEIGSVQDKYALESAFKKYQPEVVFHAAAHKHVPLMEACPRQAILNNVYGTVNAVLLADKYQVERFIFISTDKAVNPVNVMGATKRMGELIVQSFGHSSDTIFAAVRFGNVLGSHGSVIPIFKRQIAEGGPLTVTHPDIIRYFMTIPEAARLVIRAGGMAEGGEIFILDMGEPVKIVDLAKNMIKLSGFTEDEIGISYVGLRPGEKLYEELLMDDEATIKTDAHKIMISKGKGISQEEALERVQKLGDVLTSPRDEIRLALAEVVPTYTPRLENKS